MEDISLRDEENGVGGGWGDWSNKTRTKTVLNTDQAHCHSFDRKHTKNNHIICLFYLFTKFPKL